MNAMNEDRLPFNPEVLRWAREWCGLSVDEAAARVGAKPERVSAWEDIRGSQQPTVKQARNLAKAYGRPFIEFFRKSLPEVPEPALVPDYRLERGADPNSDRISLRDIQAWAEAQRENALDLFNELGEAVPEFPGELVATIKSDPEDVSTAARLELAYDIDEQFHLSWSDRTRVPDIMRRKLEGLGVLTLRKSDLKAIGARGLCLVEFPLPTIVFRSEAPTAQAFTLAHELGHIILRQSGVSGDYRKFKSSKDGSGVERWCNDFAACFYMPRAAVEPLFRGVDATLPNISDADLLVVAKRFRLSPHATLIRLVNLGIVEASFYWKVKKPIFDAEERDFRPFGRAPYYGSRYKSSMGDLYTSLVIEAWSSGRITNHNAAEYMGIKNIKHLFDIRNNFVAG